MTRFREMGLRRHYAATMKRITHCATTYTDRVGHREVTYQKEQYSIVLDDLDQFDELEEVLEVPVWVVTQWRAQQGESLRVATRVVTVTSVEADDDNDTPSFEVHCSLPRTPKQHRATQLRDQLYRLSERHPTIRDAPDEKTQTTSSTHGGYPLQKFTERTGSSQRSSCPLQTRDPDVQRVLNRLQAQTARQAKTASGQAVRTKVPPSRLTPKAVSVSLVSVRVNGKEVTTPDHP